MCFLLSYSYDDMHYCNYVKKILANECKTLLSFGPSGVEESKAIQYTRIDLFE